MYHNCFRAIIDNVSEANHELIKINLKGRKGFVNKLEDS